MNHRWSGWGRIGGRLCVCVVCICVRCTYALEHVLITHSCTHMSAYLYQMRDMSGNAVQLASSDFDVDEDGKMGVAGATDGKVRRVCVVRARRAVCLRERVGAHAGACQTARPPANPQRSTNHASTSVQSNPDATANAHGRRDQRVQVDQPRPRQVREEAQKLLLH